MTLPNSGPLSISQIAAEYGVSLPCVFPDAFYGKPGIPASGALSISTFYGKSNVTFTPDGGAVSDYEYGATAQVTLTCNVPAVWTFTLAGLATASISSGASASSVTFSLAAGSPGSNRVAAFDVTGVSDGVSRTFNISLEADYT